MFFRALRDLNVTMWLGCCECNYLRGVGFEFNGGRDRVGIVTPFQWQTLCYELGRRASLNA